MNINSFHFLSIVFLFQFTGVISQEIHSLDSRVKLSNELSFGSVYNFSIGQAAFMSVDSISPEKIIIVYRDWDNSGYGAAVIGVLNNMEMIYSNPVFFATGNIFLPEIKVVNDSEIIVIYRDMDQLGKGFIINGVIENESIYFSDPIIFSENMISTTSLIIMDDNKFILAFKDNGNNGFGTLISGSLQEGEIILSDSYIFNESTSFENVLTRFNDSTFLITYRDLGNSEKGTVKIGTFINGNLDLSQPYVFSEFKASDVSVKHLNTSKFIISYVNSDVSGVAVVGSVADGLITFSSLSPFSDTHVSGTSVIAFSDSLVIISYSDENNNGTGTSIVATINNDSIYYDDPVIFNDAGSYTTYGVRLSDSTFILAFRNEGNNFNGSSVIGKVNIDYTTGIDFFNMQNSIKVFPNPTNGAITIEGNGIIETEILNMTGQTIKTILPFKGKTIIDISEFDNGVYFLKTTQKNKTTLNKIILK